MGRCLGCYRELPDGVVDYHPACAKALFGTYPAPMIPFDRSHLGRLAMQVIRSQVAVTGVQPKLSLDLSSADGTAPSRFTIVGLWGRYILKPQTELYPHLPELEDVTMHLAEIAQIDVVPHGLIRMADGELSYITRRIDRTDQGEKIPMEDFCQLSERLTEYKYSGSHEQVAKLLGDYSDRPTFDLLSYWEVVIFSWLTGNADMHLKNFSLYRPERGTGYCLSPAYDLLSTALVLPSDTEELALTLCGKKRKLRGEHFAEVMHRSGIIDKVIENTFKKYQDAEADWRSCIARSFLPPELKEAYIDLISSRLQLLTTE